MFVKTTEQEAKLLIAKEHLVGDVNRSFEPPLFTWNKPDAKWPDSVVVKKVGDNWMVKE